MIGAEQNLRCSFHRILFPMWFGGDLFVVIGSPCYVITRTVTVALTVLSAKGVGENVDVFGHEELKCWRHEVLPSLSSATVIPRL